MWSDTNELVKLQATSINTKLAQRLIQPQRVAYIFWHVGFFKKRNLYNLYHTWNPDPMRKLMFRLMQNGLNRGQRNVVVSLGTTGVFQCESDDV